jgi:hypothetical protein
MMNIIPSEESIKIPLSKVKMGLMLLGVLAFVVAAGWILFSLGLTVVRTDAGWAVIDFDVAYLVVGVIGILFFGFCGVYITKSLFDTQPGLVVDSAGIVDNASGIAAGRIAWEDIVAVKSMQIVNQKMLMIEVVNPDEYINRQTNPLSRQLAEANSKLYGTPVFIPANTLRCNFAKLTAIMQHHFEKYKIK